MNEHQFLAAFRAAGVDISLKDIQLIRLDWAQWMGPYWATRLGPLKLLVWYDQEEADDGGAPWVIDNPEDYGGRGAEHYRSPAEIVRAVTRIQARAKG